MKRRLSVCFRVITACLLFIALLLLASCGRSSLGLEDINTEDIEKIIVSSFPSRFESVELVDLNEMESVMQYLNSLNAIRIITHPSHLTGGGYVINILLDDGTEYTVSLVGNFYAIVDNSSAYEIPYNDAIRFDTVIGDILLNRYRAEFDGTIVRGEVLAVQALASGRNGMCELRTVDGDVITVDMSNARALFDTTGVGRLIVVNGDWVEVGVDENLVVDKIFIIQLTITNPKA